MSIYRRAVRDLWLGQPATAQNTAPGTAGLKPDLGRDWTISNVIAQNRSASAVAVALIGLLPDSMWKAGQWTEVGTLYTDDTLDAQDADTNDFALETTTVNDGFVVKALVPFGAVSLDITTAGSGTSATHTLEYWNGSAWTAIVAAGTLIDVARAADWAAGEKLILFDPPTNWAKGGDAGDGIDADKYAIRVKRTNAVQATAALARRIYVGVVLTAEDDVAANDVVIRRYPGPGLVVPNYVKGVSAAFSTADEGNSLELTYAIGRR